MWSRFKAEKLMAQTVKGSVVNGHVFIKVLTKSVNLLRILDKLIKEESWLFIRDNILRVKGEIVLYLP